MFGGQIVWNLLCFRYKSDVTPASWHHPAPLLLPLPQNRRFLLQSIVGLRIIHSGMEMQVGGSLLLCRRDDDPSGGHGAMCRISKGLTSQRWFLPCGQKGEACTLVKKILQLIVLLADRFVQHGDWAEPDCGGKGEDRQEDLYCRSPSQGWNLTGDPCSSSFKP